MWDVCFGSHNGLCADAWRSGTPLVLRHHDQAKWFIATGRYMNEALVRAARPVERRLLATIPDDPCRFGDKRYILHNMDPTLLVVLLGRMSCVYSFCREAAADCDAAVDSRFVKAAVVGWSERWHPSINRTAQATHSPHLVRLRPSRPQTPWTSERHIDLWRSKCDLCLPAEPTYARNIAIEHSHTQGIETLLACLIKFNRGGTLEGKHRKQAMPMCASYQRRNHCRTGTAA